MTTERIKTVSGKELLDMDLPPIHFIVQDFMAQGLNIVSGMSKIGKSWMLLLLCLKVARGEPFWNYETEKGTVLYLCLEDSFNRIQQRLLSFTDDAPPNLHFAVMVKSLSEGLSEQIELFIAEHPDTNLIVIDTLQKVRDMGGDNVYAADYKDIGLLKEIADRHGISIACVHHVRKMTADDPHKMVSGSTGLTGAADCSYVLVRNDPNSPDAKFYIRGRDVEERVLTLHFNKETCIWEYVSGDTPAGDDMKNDSVISSILRYLMEGNEFRGTASKLIDLLHLPVKSNVLSKKLNRYENELKKIGVQFSKTRTGERREIILKYVPPMTI